MGTAGIEPATGAIIVFVSVLPLNYVPGGAAIFSKQARGGLLPGISGEPAGIGLHPHRRKGACAGEQHAPRTGSKAGFSTKQTCIFLGGALSVGILPREGVDVSSFA